MIPQNGLILSEIPLLVRIWSEFYTFKPMAGNQKIDYGILNIVGKGEGVSSEAKLLIEFKYTFFIKQFYKNVKTQICSNLKNIFMPQSVIILMIKFYWGSISST